MSHQRWRPVIRCTWDDYAQDTRLTRCNKRPFFRSRWQICKGRRGYASQALEKTRQCHQIEARCITEEASICLHCDMFLFWRDTRSTWKASWRRRGNQATVVRDERTDEKNDIVRTRAYYPFQREERRRTRENERERETKRGGSR